MKWFKHMADMANDVKIRRVLRKFGPEGYAVYVYVLERIARRLEAESPQPDLEETAEDIALHLYMDTARVVDIVEYLLSQDLLTQDEVTGRVVCMKMYKFLESSQTGNPLFRKMIQQYREIKSHDSVMISHDSVSADKIRLDEIRLDERKSAAKATHAPTGKPMNQARYDRLVASWGPLVDRYIAKAAAWADANGKRYRDFAAVAESWLTRDEEAGKVSRPKPLAKLETIEEKRRRIFEEEA